jgi:hypothetical protein
MPTRDLLEVMLRGTPQDLDAERQRVAATKGKGDRTLVAAAEQEVATAPERAITFDGTGPATVTAGARHYCGGRFALRSIRELEASVAKKRAATGPQPVKLSVLEGQDPVTDIGALQAMASDSSLFQAASQFNCLEAPDACLVPVANYLRDPTQGPRASVSAFPATLVRHYAAPDGTGGRFVQSEEHQIDLLNQALPASIGRVESGYLMLSNVRDVPAAARALEERFTEIRVGVHDEAQVVLGHAWDGAVEGEPRIAQVFTSTLAAGGYGRGEAFAGPVETICRQLLRAAYLGTLLAALDLGKSRAVLTMIGGGVFGNPHWLICESVVWAVEKVQPFAPAPLEVVLNSRDLDPEVDRAWLRAECERRGGGYRELGGHRSFR